MIVFFNVHVTADLWHICKRSFEFKLYINLINHHTALPYMKVHKAPLIVKGIVENTSISIKQYAESLHLAVAYPPSEVGPVIWDPKECPGGGRVKRDPVLDIGLLFCQLIVKPKFDRCKMRCDV